MVLVWPYVGEWTNGDGLLDTSLCCEEGMMAVA